jgi:small-conductance mechanosensitive channel
VFPAWQIVRDRPVLGVPAGQWAVFAALTGGLFLVLYLARGIARGRQAGRAARTGRAADAHLARLLERTWSATLLAVSALAALHVVDLHVIRPLPATGAVEVVSAVRTLAILVVFLQVGRWGTSLIDSVLEQGFRLAKLSESTAQTALGVVRFFALAALWTSVAIPVLSTLGVEVTPLLAGLGVGGIAAGFALQRILGDIFCSVAIVLDRPFEVGDFIQAGEFMGSVERIGVKTTRVRSLGGEQIIFPNADLIQSRLRNFKRMTERRMVFHFNVAYGTPVATLEQIPGLVREIIAGLEMTRIDRAHLTALGETGMSFEVVYFVLDPDYNRAMDIQQQINLALCRAFEGLGIRFVLTKPSCDVAETEKKD